MAGDLSNANNPHVRDTGTPILHIMETNDEYDPYQHSIEWDRDNLTAPRWMSHAGLEPRAAVHAARRPHFELMSSITTVDFLDGTLKGHPERLDDLTRPTSTPARVGWPTSSAELRVRRRGSMRSLADLAAEDLAGGGLRDLVDASRWSRGS